MSVILVVERDASRVKRISEVLRRDGLSVTTAASRAEAVNRAEERTPGVMLVSSALPDVSALLTDFSRRRGGPGTIVVLEGTAPSSTFEEQADEVLVDTFSDDELRERVQRCLKQPDRRGATTPGPTEPEQLTSADIFGDVLAEVEAEALNTNPAPVEQKPARPMADIERRLEETLSGVLPVASKGKTRKRPTKSPLDHEIDELLDQTLSSLDIPTRSKKPPVPTATAPPEATRDDRPARAAISQPPPVDIPPTPERDTTALEDSEPALSPLATETEPQQIDPVVEPESSEAPEPLEKAPMASDTGTEQGSAPAVSIPETSFVPAADATNFAPLTWLDDLQPDANQFRTQALPTFDLPAEAPGDSAAAVFSAEATPAVPPSGETPGEAFGDYTLLDRIAVGGMAEVWRARRRGVEGFQKTVAIKKILSHLTGSQDFITMFIDEAKLAAQLSHNNIIQIYDLGKVGGDYFIAMEHVDGKDLRSILTAAQESGRPIPLGLGLLIVSAVAQALDYAHRKRDFDNRALGLVHRDVSPQNVMISYEGTIKLCDFGIVKAVVKASTTQMGALKGKLQYMSPEQAWSKNVDARSDIFSLGSVLYEVLTGTQLFSGDSEIGVLDAVRECQISSPRKLVPEIPKEVARIVLKALAKSPAERYQTAGDFDHDIRAVLDNLPTLSQKDLATYMCSLFETTRSGAIALAALGDTAAESTAMPTAEPSASPITPVAESPTAEESSPSQPEGIPAAVEEKSGPRAGHWKWLAAAVLAAILAVIGFLVLPPLFQQEAFPPAATPTPQAQETAPPTAPAITPAPLEDATAAALDDPTSTTGTADRVAPDGDAPSTETTEATENPTVDVTEPAEPDSTVTAAGIDIEEMVNEELTHRADQLRRDFEAEKKRIEEELARTQQKGEQPAEPAEKDGGGPSPKT